MGGARGDGGEVEGLLPTHGDMYGPRHIYIYIYTNKIRSTDIDKNKTFLNIYLQSC